MQEDRESDEAEEIPQRKPRKSQSTTGSQQKKQNGDDNESDIDEYNENLDETMIQKYKGQDQSLLIKS